MKKVPVLDLRQPSGRSTSRKDGGVLSQASSPYFKTTLWTEKAPISLFSYLFFLRAEVQYRLPVVQSLVYFPRGWNGYFMLTQQETLDELIFEGAEKEMLN